MAEMVSGVYVNVSEFGTQAYFVIKEYEDGGTQQYLFVTRRGHYMALWNPHFYVLGILFLNLFLDASFFTPCAQIRREYTRL